MDGSRFDDLSRILAAGLSRRAALKAATGGLLAAFGVRTVEAQASQASCGNQLCASNPGGCKPGCVCCVYANGNSRCRPAGQCGSGAVACPAGLTYCPHLGRCAACCTNADCDDGNACTQNVCTFGVCTHPPIACDLGGTCIDGVCSCVPSCVGAACGAPDGCGGVCGTGTCPVGRICLSNGSCALPCASQETCELAGCAVCNATLQGDFCVGGGVVGVGCGPSLSCPQGAVCSDGGCRHLC